MYPSLSAKGIDERGLWHWGHDVISNTLPSTETHQKQSSQIMNDLSRTGSEMFVSFSKAFDKGYHVSNYRLLNVRS